MSLEILAPLSEHPTKRSLVIDHQTDTYQHFKTTPISNHPSSPLQTNSRSNSDHFSPGSKQRHFHCNMIRSLAGKPSTWPVSSINFKTAHNSVCSVRPLANKTFAHNFVSSPAPVVQQSDSKTALTQHFAPFNVRHHSVGIPTCDCIKRCS